MKNNYSGSLFKGWVGKLALMLTLFAFFQTRSMQAQTTLVAGDIAFTGYNSASSANQFSFVILRTGGISAGTTINFTDNGWNSLTGALATNEGTIAWTASSALPQFTQVTLQANSTGNAMQAISSGSATISGALIFSGSGDQVIAYQGTSASPTFIAGLHMNYEVANGSSAASSQAGWDDLNAAGWAYTSQRSAIPPGLTGGVNAMMGAQVPIVVPAEKDNGIYNCTGSVAATVSAIRASINDPANWSLQDVTLYALPPSCTFALSTPLTATISASTNVSCNGGANGSATVTASGGTSPYTYSWSPSGGTNATATGRPAGNYTVTVTDASSQTATATVTITQPSAFSISTAQANVSCFGGSNGAAAVSVAGGTAPYTYSWSPSGGTNATASGRPAGNYTVTITDANSCTATRTFSITQPAAPVSGTTVVTNVACFGGNTGAINLTPAGGTAPYTFNWGSSITTEDRTNLTAGTYTVVITDNNGCTGTVTATVTQPTSPVSGTTVVTNVACFGGSNGAINLTPSGGTGPYTFNWLPSGPTTEDRTGLTAGTYSVVITDANGCTGTVTTTVTQPTAPVSGSTVVTNVACFGGNTGAINLTPSGGTGSYTFNWLPSGPTTEDRTGLVAGTYSVVITDANGCTGTVTASVTQPTSPVSGTTVVTNVACFGGNTGAINLTPTGGTGPYTFNWLPSGPTTEDRTGLVAGTYTVVITDANGCTGTVTASVTQPTSPVSGTTVVTNVACFGGNTGAINLTPTGGTGPYTFNWLPSGPTTEDRTGLVAGTYSVVITDANGCTGTVTASVTQPTSPVSGTTVVTNVACFGGNTGAINLTPTGGTGPYTFNWLPSGPTTEDRTGLVAGTYSVVITDVNGCTGTVTATVTQPTSPVSGTTVVTNVACFGGNTGAINLTPTGGTGPYTFNWGSATTEDRTGLTSGTYTVVITDANGCTGTVTASVTQPTSPVSGTTVVTNVACFGGNTGAINLTPTGGTGPYTFNWLPSGPTTEDRTGLVAGTYSVVITDANGCTGTVTASVTQPTSPVSGTTVVTNVACFGGNTGAINLTPTGGTGPYTFNWLPSGPTTEDRTGLVAGTYSVVITDANGCTGTVTASVTQPTSPVSGTTVVTNVSCNGGSNGSIDLTPTGGTPGYTYNWGGGITTQDRTGLAAGTYTVVITDANGCTGTVIATVTQPAALATTGTSASVSCNGGSNGSASVTVTGGTSPYTYAWSPSGGTNATASGLAAGSYTVTATDNKGCVITRTYSITQPALITLTTSSTTSACSGNTGTATVSATGGTGAYTYSWSTAPVQTTAMATALAAGSYTVTVTDANGCVKTATVSVANPSGPSASISTPTNVSCFGGSNGSATVTATGGAAPYIYSWNTTPAQTTATATGLAAGSYTVTVADANNCQATASVTITQPANIVLTATSTNVSCNGGSNGTASVTGTGGTGAYTYSWAPSGGTNATATGLAAGSYTVTVTDANGCVKTASVSITQPPVLIAAASGTNVSCFGGSNGSAISTATGGTGAYTYSWSTTPAQTTSMATGLSAGNYTVTVTDANGCQATASVSITQPTAIVVTTSQVNVTCNTGADGSATATASGGTGSLTYSWSTTPAQTGVNAAGLTAGNYTVTVTDANGCQATASVSITEPTAIVVTTSQLNVTCNTGADGSATASATGGTGTITYSWNTTPAQTGAAATGLTAGSYVVTATDASGCFTNVTVTITEPAAIVVTTSQVNVTCNTGADGSATAAATGGTGSITYSWNTTPAQTGATATGLAAGTYVVTATDASGCFTDATVTITEPTAIVLTTSQVNVTCNAGTDGSATASATGGTGTITYSWLPSGGTGATETGLSAGTYTVTATDAAGCFTTATVSITEPAAVTASTTSTNETCAPGSDGTATVMAAGGSGTFTYLWDDALAQNTATATGLVAGVYSVTVNDGVCPAITATVTVNGSPAPVITLSNDTSICEGTTATLIAAGGTSYSWDNGAGSTDTVMVAPSVTTTYNVTVTDNNGCTATGAVTVTVDPLVAAGFTYVNTGAVVDFTNTSANATAYSWDFGDGSPADNTQDPSHTYVLDGTYTVTLVAMNSCGNDTITDTIVIFTTGIDEQAAMNINVAPNPSEGIFIVTVNNAGAATISAVVTDMQGRTVYTNSISNNERSKQLDLTHLAKGIYYLQLDAGDKRAVSRIVIQ